MEPNTEFPPFEPFVDKLPEEPPAPTVTVNVDPLTAIRLLVSKPPAPPPPAAPPPPPATTK
jgi:hypothetical protein